MSSAMVEMSEDDETKKAVKIKLTLCRAAQRSDIGNFSRRHLTSGNVAIIWRQIIDGVDGVESFTSYPSYDRQLG